ncbi:MAG TPA: MFS transporter [Candidatus Limnocylindria bacterium]
MRSEQKLVSVVNFMIPADFPLRLLRAAMPPQLRVVGGGPAPGTAPAPRPPRGGRLRRGFSALAHRNYRLYLGGQIVSLVGTWMQSVSQPWLVLLLGGTPIQLGIVLALQFTPPMLLAPLGGVLADRVDKRKVLMGTQVLAMLQATALFTLTFSGVVEIWHVFVLAAVLGTVSAVEMPVRQAFAAELVPGDDLVNAIALNSATFNAARIIGPAIAGVTLALFGPAANFGINAVSYLGVLTGLWLMDPAGLHRVQRPTQVASVLSSLAEGVRYAVREPSILWPLVLLGGVSLFGMNFQTLLPLFARNSLGLDAGAYGAMWAIMGIGSLAGSLYLAFSDQRRRLAWLIIGGGAAFAVFELLMGLFPVVAFAFPAIVVMGLGSMLMINTINVTIQNAVSHELRGRVMSLYVTVFAGSTPFGGLLAGSLAELFGPARAFAIGAAASLVILGLVAWRLLSTGALRQVERPSTLPRGDERSDRGGPSPSGEAGRAASA